MAKILEKLLPASLLAILLALILIFAFHNDHILQASYFGPFFIYLHVLSGITWIGLLYYFNLVQIPTMPKVPAELKPAVSKFIAPEALFWFRWSALSTLLTGLIIVALGQAAVGRTLYTGMTLGLIMAFNVWFIIWPNQKKALGIVQVDDTAKSKAARVAMLASRTNFVLSFPMLYCMITARLVG